MALAIAIEGCSCDCGCGCAVIFTASVAAGHAESDRERERERASLVVRVCLWSPSGLGLGSRMQKGEKNEPSRVGSVGKQQVRRIRPLCNVQ